MDFIEDSLRRLREDHPDLAVLIMAILNELAEIRGHMASERAPKRPDLSKLVTPQGLLFTGGGIALFLQVPLPTIIEFFKAASPFILP